jgi:hypothetical protein
MIDAWNRYVDRLQNGASLRDLRDLQQRAAERLQQLREGEENLKNRLEENRGHHEGFADLLRRILREHRGKMMDERFRVQAVNGILGWMNAHDGIPPKKGLEVPEKTIRYAQKARRYIGERDNVSGVYREVGRELGQSHTTVCKWLGRRNPFYDPTDKDTEEDRLEKLRDSIKKIHSCYGREQA